jgi:galactonate dehydratase
LVGRYDVVTPVLKVVDGHLPVPDAPGLGVDLVEEEIARYPGRRNVADMPPDEGSAYEAGTVGENVYFQTRLRRRSRLRLTRT